MNIINWQNVLANSNSFQNNKPFPYGFVEDVFEKKFYDKLYQTYPKEDEYWYVPKDWSRSSLKRFFGKDEFGVFVDDEDPNLSKEWNDFHHYINTKEFVENMTKYTGIKLKGVRHFGFIKNRKGDFNMPHRHYGESQNNIAGYDLTILMYFAKDWKKGDPGGTYVCANEDEASIIFEPYNLDNSMMCFKETPYSWHGSRYMTKDVIRPSIQFTMF